MRNRNKKSLREAYERAARAQQDMLIHLFNGYRGGWSGEELAAARDAWVAAMVAVEESK